MSESPYTGPEKREHPRFSINLEKSFAYGNERVPIMDVSWGGVRLFSKHPHAEQKEVEFAISGFLINAQVLECVDEGDDCPDPDYPYRMRCQFVLPPHHPDIKTLMKIVWDAELGQSA